MTDPFRHSRTVAALCAQYRAGGLTDARVEDARILVCTGKVEGVQMPGELGAGVYTELRENSCRTPIIENLATGFLTFLTGPAPVGDVRSVHLDRAHAERAHATGAGSCRLGVIRTVVGVDIVLPGAGDPVRRWYQEERPAGWLARFDDVAALAFEAGMGRSQDQHRAGDL